MFYKWLLGSFNICDIYLSKKISKRASTISSKFKKNFYFSDGCAGQYKNRYNFSNISYHEKDFGVKCEWHFFATSHGKNACDGIGGTVKHAAYRHSLSCLAIFWNQKTYMNFLLKILKKLNFFMLAKKRWSLQPLF